jgi:hypothetical protein
MRPTQIIGGMLLLALVAGCGTAREGTFDPDLIGGNPQDVQETGTSTIWDLFGANTQDQTINVNKYIWAASLDVLNFLPVQTVDPFSGVIVTGFGTPPGGGRAYRATVHISDPALDARSLSLSLQTRNGPASAATTRAVEDAILSRARQLRISDSRF